MAKGKEEKYKCSACGTEYINQTSNFYLSYGRVYDGNNNRMTVCKECIDKIYDELYERHHNVDKCIYEMCRLLDLCFNRNILSVAIKLSESQGCNIGKAYAQKVNVVGANNRVKFTFKDSEPLEVPIQTDDSDVEYEDVSNENYIVTPDMRKRWGKGLDAESYDFLEEQYQSLISVYEHKTPIQNMIYEDIAKTRLEANKARVAGKMADYEKAMNLVSKLMTDANIKPVQENASGDTGMSTWGEWIKKIEETEPIPEPKEEFKDVDGIWKYISKWFVGHFAKIFGLMNDETTINDKVENMTNKKEGD